ncbi:hypothetical protein V1264_010538 [Littorina saxatilis]
MVIADVAAMPMWKTEFYHFRNWEGNYMYHGESHPCSIAVQSVQEDDSGVAYVSFVAENTHLDMNAFSSDNIRIMFRQNAVYNTNHHFYDVFEFVVELVPQGRVQVLIGNITRPASNFSTIRLQSEKSRGYENHSGASGLSVGLAIGISVFLFIVCIVVGILILRWGIRKGYLRHVARSYKNFRNPEGAASFDNTQSDTRDSNVDVHI